MLDAPRPLLVRLSAPLLLAGVLVVAGCSGGEESGGTSGEGASRGSVDPMQLADPALPEARALSSAEREQILDDAAGREVGGDVMARTIGQARAPVSVTVFTGLTCPACRHFEQRLLPWLNERFVPSATIRIRVIGIAEGDASAAAQTAQHALACAADSPAYWTFRRRLSADTDEWTLEGNTRYGLSEAAARVGIDRDALLSCLDDEGFRALMAERLALARRVGVTRLPTFFVNGRAVTVDGGSFAPLVDAINEAYRGS